MVRLRCCKKPLGTASLSRPTLHPRALPGRKLTIGPALVRPGGATPTSSRQERPSEWRSQSVAETGAAVRVLCALVGCGRGAAADPFAVSTIRPGASGLFPPPVGKPAMCHRVPELMWVNVPNAGGGAMVEKLANSCPSEGSGVSIHSAATSWCGGRRAPWRRTAVHARVTGRD
jgi:hypothetical protein